MATSNNATNNATPNVTANSVVISQASSAVTGVAPGTSGNVLTSNGTIWSSSPPATSGTVTSLTAGTGITLTPNPITSTGSIALTVPVTEILGGTNQTTYTLGDTLYSSAANTLSKLAGNITAVKQYLSQTGTGAVSAAPAWATISGADITGAALTAGNDTNVTLTLGGTPATSLLRAASVTAGWTGTLSLARGGTAAALTASNGGIFYSTASAGAILSGTATANQILMSGASTTPAWSTATYPATTTVSQILYSSSANVIGGITTANDGVLVTSNTGVPSFLANSGTPGFVLTANSGAPPSWQVSAGSGTVNSGTINDLAYYAASGTAVSALSTANSSGLLTNGSGVPAWVTVTGTGAPVLATSPTITTPIIAQINDVHNNPIFLMTPVTSAVNSITINNAITGSKPVIAVSGSDTNVGLALQAQAAGIFQFFTTATSNQLVIETGATFQHVTTMSFPSTSASQTVTFPDASGTVGLTATGTWTPIDASGASLSFSTATGTYIQIGNLVICTGYVVYPSTASASPAIIGGLPVVTGSTNQKMGGNVVQTTVATLAHAITLTANTAFSLYTTSGAAVLNSAMTLSTNTFQVIYFT